jgi:hypothetical protein
VSPDRAPQIATRTEAKLIEMGNRIDVNQTAIENVIAQVEEEAAQANQVCVR